ncbi:MAG TPA: four helix bundle protein [Balneolaceae bacterium]|nr:four helix bundle protein [Balneolaceae bacterium]
MGRISFEKLDVWQMSREFTAAIYEITSKFPAFEKFGLTSQLRRASGSVSSNIAEGSSRATAKEQGRFYNLAYSSAVEILNQLIISRSWLFKR